MFTQAMGMTASDWSVSDVVKTRPNNHLNLASLICHKNSGVCGTEVAFNIKQATAGWLHSSLLETSKLQLTVYIEWKLFASTPHSC